MKLAFIDTEFTGEHGKTTLVSIGIVTLNNKKLYITLNDYNKSQVTPWLKKNVLSKINHKNSISSFEAYKKISKFLKSYAKNDKINIVSAGKISDISLLFDLYRYKKKNKNFHWLHDLPKYLNHNFHLDLNTMFYFANLNVTNREKFANLKLKIDKHNALYDAIIVRSCFIKALKFFPNIKKKFKKIKIEK